MTALWIGLALALNPGSYALEVEVLTSSRVPVVGEKQVRTVSSVLATLREGPDGWLQDQRTCGVRVEGGGPARTTIPPAFLEALPEQTHRVELEGGRYRVDGGPVTTGADPVLGLPRRPDDPGVQDPDGDGHPGVTVWIDAPVVGRVEMYVVQRAHSVLEGQVQGSGAAGTVEVKFMDQRTLGASNKLLAISPRITVVPGQSSFRLVAIDQPSCDAVLRALR